MICIVSPSNNAHFNMAADEYILDAFSEDVFMLYKNKSSIIVGRHQNTLSEINGEYVRTNGIDVVRRSSGGGAVFHDLGNLNFTFVMTDSQKRKDVDFKKFTDPIISLLRKLGVNANFEGRNDLTIDGKKFSGNAGLRKGDRVLSHGTLLFDADLKRAAAALRTDPEKYRHKKVKSVASRITNIRDHLKNDIDVDTFEEMLVRHVVSLYPDARDYSFTPGDIKVINSLRREKYDTWEWNYGKTGKYDLKKTVRTSGGTITAELCVKGGRITDIFFSGDYFGDTDSKELAEIIIGHRHDYTELSKLLESVDLTLYMHGVTAEDILGLLF